MTTFMSVKLYTLNQDLFLNPSYGSISLCKLILALTQMSFNFSRQVAFAQRPGYKIFRRIFLCLLDMKQNRLFNDIEKKGLIEEYLRTILEPWRSTQEAEGVALEMRQVVKAAREFKSPLLLIFLWLYRGYGKFCSVNVPQLLIQIGFYRVMEAKLR